MFEQNSGKLKVYGIKFIPPAVRYLLLGLVFFSVSCDEQKRIIEPFIPAGARVVLLEEFTGKGCTHCPKGSREIENLLTLFPNNLVAVSIHAGFFADPSRFPIGQYDFRTMEGEFLYDYLGPNLGYPAAVVNRTPVNNEMQISANAWGSAIANEILTAPAVELNIDHEYNTTTRELNVSVSGISKKVLAGDVRLSILITQDSIIDAQDDFEQGGIVQNYVHKHVLRDMLTPATGTPVSNGMFIGQTFSHSFSAILDIAWVPQHIEVIAFITVIDGDKFPVLQAGGVRLIP